MTSLNTLQRKLETTKTEKDNLTKVLAGRETTDERTDINNQTFKQLVRKMYCLVQKMTSDRKQLKSQLRASDRIIQTQSELISILLNCISSDEEQSIIQHIQKLGVLQNTEANNMLKTHNLQSGTQKSKTR